MIGRYCVTLVAAIALATSKSESAPTQSTAGRNEGERHTVVVDPAGRGDSTTIQGGIDLVPPGGRVKVLPGTYPEALVIGKGLTLEGVARRRGAVLVAPSGTPTAAVQVTTSEQVTLRNLTVHSPGANGIGGQGTLDLTIERVNVLAINPSVPGNLIVVVNNGGSGRATLVVVDSHVDGAITGPVSSPQVFGIRVGGDIDAWLVGNEIRRTGGACIVVSPRADLKGRTNADIVNNDLDECYPTGRVASIIVGPGFPLPSPLPPITAEGTVNIIGNKIANTKIPELCHLPSAISRPTSAISYEYFGGRIERNQILGVVQSCAAPTVRNLPAAIWLGTLYSFPADKSVVLQPVVVRHNDIVGNAQAGLRVAATQTSPVDATCNWWGSATGPSGAGPGSGDAVIVEGTAPTPRFTPFATRPVARTDGQFEGEDAGACAGESD